MIVCLPCLAAVRNQDPASRGEADGACPAGLAVCVSLQERSQSTQALPGALLPAARGAGTVGLAQLPCLPGAVPPGAAAPAPLLLSAGPPSAAPGDSSWPWGPSGEEKGRAWPQCLLPAGISFSEPYSH